MPPEVNTTADLRRAEARLDALQTGYGSRVRTAASEHPLRRLSSSVLPPVLFVAALVVAWQLAVTTLHPPVATLPSPAAVGASLGAAWASGSLPAALATSLGRALLGFAAAIVLGTVLGLLLADLHWLRRCVGPIVSGLMVLPSVAWVPAALLWFGPTNALVLFTVLMGGVPSIVNGLLAGVDHVPPQLRRVGQVLGAGRIRGALLVVLPAALPGYLAGLKQGWAFAWRGVLAAEIIAVGSRLGPGVGGLLQRAHGAKDMAGVIASILVILVIGIVVELAILAPIERRVLRARGLQPGGAR